MLQIVSQAILSLIRLTLQKLSRFFSYLSAGFQICDVVWAMDDFCSRNVSPWLLYLVIFFSKVRLFSTLVKNQSSETAVQYKTAVLFTLSHSVSLGKKVRLFQHLVKIKKINFLKINFFKYLYTLHSTLYTWQSVAESKVRLFFQI